jgi:hypothetical protein
MAATATEQIINDGPRRLTLKYTIAGTSGDTAAGDLVDATAFNDKDGTALGANSLTLMGIEAALTGFSCNLLWDATANVNLVEIPSDEFVCHDFSGFGGIKDNSGSGSTGKILFTTTGYTASGDGGTIVLRLRKT